MEKKKLPDVLDMAKNLVATAKDVVSDAVDGKDVIASKEKINQRIATCEKCDWSYNRKCLKCGCFISIKVNLNSSKCPLDKWDK